MITLDSSHILQFLMEKGVDAQIQKETGQICFSFKKDQREWPVFIRIYEDNGLMQALGFFPVQLQENALPDTARLLHLFNKELDVPGFGMDEESKTVFFRCLLPTHGNRVHSELVWNMISTVKSICEGFSQAVEAISLGATTLVELTQQAAAMRSKEKES